MIRNLSYSRHTVKSFRSWSVSPHTDFVGSKMLPLRCPHPKPSPTGEGVAEQALGDPRAVWNRHSCLCLRTEDQRQNACVTSRSRVQRVEGCYTGKRGHPALDEMELVKISSSE